MRYKLFLVLFVCVFVSTGFAQDGELEFDIQFATASFPFDGSESELISGQPLIGVRTTLDLMGLQVFPGLYLAGDLSFNNGTESNWSLGPAFYAEFIKGIGIGVAYDALVEGEGFGFGKDRLAFILGYDINF